jgi:hypothetical protein
MDRDDFEDLRDRLDAILAPVKFRLGEEVYSHASFGSMYAVWSRRGESVRLVWDGKDGVLMIEANRQGKWDYLASGSPSEAETLLDAARAHVS